MQRGTVKEVLLLPPPAFRLRLNVDGVRDEVRAPEPIVQRLAGLGRPSTKDRNSSA